LKSAIIVAAILALPVALQASPKTAYKYADTSTAAPNGAGVYTSFEPPSVDNLGSTLILASFVATTSTGLHVINGYHLASTAQPMPGFGQNFGSFSSLSGYQSMAFKATGTDGVSTGFYVLGSSGPTLVAKPGDSVGGQIVQSLGGISSYDGSFVFETDFGIFAPTAGQFAPLITTTSALATPMGLHHFRSTDFIRPVFSSNLYIAFIADDANGAEGVYFRVSSNKLVGVDTATPIPDGQGVFSSFGSPTTSSANMVFPATGAGQDGIYKMPSTGAPLTCIANLDTPVPGDPTAHFASFGTVIENDGNTLPNYPQEVFYATLTDGREGIYMSSNGSLTKYLDTGDTLNGMPLSHLALSTDGYAAELLAFKATFIDGSQGIYEDIPQVPEPSVTAVIPIAAFCFGARRCRRRCTSNCPAS
jgi:hypothetical protein